MVFLPFRWAVSIQKCLVLGGFGPQVPAQDFPRAVFEPKARVLGLMRLVLLRLHHVHVRRVVHDEQAVRARLRVMRQSHEAVNVTDIARANDELLLDLSSRPLRHRAEAVAQVSRLGLQQRDAVHVIVLGREGLRRSALAVQFGRVRLEIQQGHNALRLAIHGSLVERGHTRQIRLIHVPLELKEHRDTIDVAILGGDVHRSGPISSGKVDVGIQIGQDLECPLMSELRRKPQGGNAVRPRLVHMGPSLHKDAYLLAGTALSGCSHQPRLAELILLRHGFRNQPHDLAKLQRDFFLILIALGQCLHLLR
mmetsp:Transcript_89171/g.238054  ORF Transcript_89171/g.238054 Transcript_89171/m.238054 type:complete len:309 (-) Transcript_89171:2032-2958(-)